MSMSPSTAWAKLTAALTQMAAIDAGMKASLADWDKQADAALAAFEALSDAPDAVSDIADLLSRSYGESEV